MSPAEASVTKANVKWLEELVLLHAVPFFDGTLTCGFLSLLTSGEYSDMKIVCKPKIWNVHRNIVCAKSDFFKAAIQGIFLVN